MYSRQVTPEKPLPPSPQVTPRYHCSKAEPFSQGTVPNSKPTKGTGRTDPPRLSRIHTVVLLEPLYISKDSQIKKAFPTE